MSTTTRFDERVVALRRDYPLKFRILELVAESLLREAQEEKALRQEPDRRCG
jgi:hypothetical protein